MAVDESALMQLLRAIAAGDAATASRLLVGSPGLARQRLEVGASRQSATAYHLATIGHYVYAGDSALHVASAAYRVDIARELIGLGADVRARNRRGAEPLHYAADGGPGSPSWNPAAQAATIVCLIEKGADPKAVDKSGVMPLHRAVRTRCASAVSALLDRGADPQDRNGSGSTAMDLAIRNTGRGGSGSPRAKAQQAEIIRLLEQHAKSQHSTET
jgi:hypothetical protein